MNAPPPPRRKNKKHDWIAIKAELLRMASAGEIRPTASKHVLGRALTYLTCTTHCYYDPVFAETVRAARPDWFDPTQWKVGRRYPKAVEQIAAE